LEGKAAVLVGLLRMRSDGAEMNKTALKVLVCSTVADSGVVRDDDGLSSSDTYDGVWSTGVTFST
jgi:hypothetical protein